MEHLGNKWIAGGKYQYWGSRTITRKGNELYPAVNNTNATCVSSGGPTYWPMDPEKLPDCIDFFIMQNVCSYYTDVTCISDLSSDHVPVVLTLSNTLIRKFKIPKLTSKNTDWEAFAEKVASKINLHIRLKTEKELEEALNTFIEVVTIATKQATPAISVKQRVVDYPKVVREHVWRHRWANTSGQQHGTRCTNLSSTGSVP